MSREELARWEARFAAHLRGLPADSAHDLAHVRRVVRATEQIADAEGAALEVALPAAWLHDLVAFPKNHPQRAQASQLSAEAATALLREWGYPAPLLPAIAHAIAAHSFSAGRNADTLEARVVQDADRLDALGAIGIARCFATSGAMNRPFYDEMDPFARHRELDDLHFAVDHFERKLFRIAETLHTNAAREMAAGRVEHMRGFLRQLAAEIE